MHRRGKRFAPSRTSPIRTSRACLCKHKNTYSIKCCKGDLANQGIGRIEALAPVDPLSGPSIYITQWVIPSDNYTIELPYVLFGGIYSGLIDWGDGTDRVDNTYANRFHTYAQAGTYTVRIGHNQIGQTTGWIFPFLHPNRNDIVDVIQWGNLEVSAGGAFFECTQMDVSATDIPHFSGLTDVSAMFNSCTSLVGNPSFENWDLSTITTLNTMFTATQMNEDLSGWDVSNVNDMTGVFSFNSVFNQPIGSWDTSNATNMNGMFRNASSFNQNLNSWDTSSLTNSNSMFFNASSFNQPVDNWDTSNVTNMVFMFRGATSFNQDLDNWDVSNVTNINEMFRDATSFNRNIEAWDTASVEFANGVFEGATAFNQPLDGFIGTATTQISSIFEGATSFNQTIDTWNVSNVIDLNNVFKDATSYNFAMGSWDTSSVTEMISTFENATAFDRDLANWDFSNVTDMTGFMAGKTDADYSADNYRLLLDSLTGQSVQNSVVLDMGSIKYPADAQPARDFLVNTKSWTIIDGGQV